MPEGGPPAVIGIGTTGYFKRGAAPMGALGLSAAAIASAAEDAGIDAHQIDGIVSFAEDPSEAPRLAATLGLKSLRWASMVWGGGAGGLASAFDHAAAALDARRATYVAIVRGVSQADLGRMSEAVSGHYLTPHHTAHGILAPAQVCALRTQRLIEHDGLPRETLRAIARADYHHARNNPEAVGRQVDLSDAAYDSSRWIAEPYRLFDCSRENDGAAAMVLTTPERAIDARRAPAYVVGCEQFASGTQGDLLENDDAYSSGGFGPVAERLWASTGLRPEDIDVIQVHDNFTGMAVAALIDHGFCTVATAGQVLRFENLIAPTGRLPINTNGGNLAEGMLHGANVALEAVRQIRGDSCNQVPDVKFALVIGGPAGPLVSSAILARDPLREAASTSKAH